jgi:ferritin-like protein
VTEATNDSSNPMVTATEKGASRRGFLTISGAAGLGLLAAACGSNSTTAGPASSSSSTNSSRPSGDAGIAKTAASLEVLAVGTYKAALDAATGGKLGAVPPAVATFVQTAMAHHQMALDSWNGILTSAGAQKVSTPPTDLKATVDAAFAKVTDVVGAAKLALLLEQTAADTYLVSLPLIMNKDAVTLAGALQSVDQEHSAILLYVLGQYPVPDVFQKGDKAYAGTGS